MCHDQSPNIVKWVQTGHRDKDESGHLVFMDKNESVVLKLNLHKKGWSVLLMDRLLRHGL